MEEGEVAEGSNGEERKAEQGQLEIAPGNEGGLLHTEDLAKTAGVSERHSQNSAETPKCFEDHGNAASLAFITCPKCNIELSVKKKFCSGCGKKVQEIIEDLKKSEDRKRKERLTTVKCPRCENDINLQKDNFCSGCGEAVKQIKASLSVTKGGLTSNTSLNNSDESPTQGTNLVSAGAQSTSTGKATTVSVNDAGKRQQSDSQKSHQTDEFLTQSGHQTIQCGPNETLPQQEVIQSIKYNRVFGQHDPNAKKLGEQQQEKTNQNIVDNNKSGARQRDEDVIEATHEDKEQRRNSVPNRSEARPQACLVLSEQTKTASVNDAAKKQQSNGQSDHETIQQGRPNETLLQQSMLQSSKGHQVFGEDDRNSEKLGDPKKGKTKPNIDDYSKNGEHHHAGGNVVIAAHVGTEQPQNSVPNESGSRPEANLSPSKHAENQPQSNANTNLTGTRKTDESLSNQKTDNAVSSQNVGSPSKEKSDGNTEKNLMNENARDRVNERNNSNNQETEDEKIERNSHAQAQIKKPSKAENQQSSTDLPRENCSTDPLSNSGDTNVDNNSSSKETADQNGYYYTKPHLTEDKETRRKGKGKKNQRDKTQKADECGKANAPQRTGVPSKIEEANGVTIVFHALLSPKFKWNEKMCVGIRGAGPHFHDWQFNAVEINPVESPVSKDVILCGKITIPVEEAMKRIPYKYVLVVNGELVWEELVEFSNFGGIVDRCLVIPKKCVKANGTWHQFDGVVCPQRGKFDFVWKYIPGVKNIGREDAFRVFFPWWNGFHMSKIDSSVTVVQALAQLSNLVETLSRPWIMREYRGVYQERIPVDRLNLPQIIEDILAPKIKSNLDILSAKPKDTSSTVCAVISSVVISHVVCCHSVPLHDDLLKALLKSMKVPPDKTVCTTLVEELGEIKEIAESVLKLFVNSVKRNSLFADSLCLLPLLHFLRGDSKPYTEPEFVSSINYKKFHWWGLSGIDVGGVSRSMPNSNNIMKMVPELSDLFAVDRLFQRSLSLFCPIDVYGDLLHSGYFRVADLCMSLRRMLSQRFQRMPTDDLIKSLSLFFHAVNETLIKSNKHEKLKDEILDENERLIETLTNLLEIIIRNIRLSHVDVLCQVTEILLTLIMMNRNCVDHQKTEDCSENRKTIPEERLNNLRKTEIMVNSFLERELKSIHLLDCSSKGELNNEFKIWSKLLSINASDETVREIWNQSLLKTLTKRVKQIKSEHVINLFCNVDISKYHPEVASCLSDAAFAAVDSVMKSGRGAQDAFKGLSQSAVQSDGGAVYGKLLNQMLKRSWPVENVDEEISEGDLLQHVLTWPTWCGFLEFFGSHTVNRGLLPAEGQIMMAQVETSIIDLVDSVESGSITVEKLEMLEKHSKEFLALAAVVEKSKVRSSSADQNSCVTAVLRDRCGELQAFHKDKKLLKSFISFCDTLRSVDQTFVDLREKVYLDCRNRSIRDLCSRDHTRVVRVHFFNMNHQVKAMISTIYNIEKSKIFKKSWQKHCKKVQENSVTLKDILESVWLPVKNEMLSSKEEFLNGRMAIEKVKKYLRMLDSNFEEVKAEFDLLIANFKAQDKTSQDEKSLLNIRIQQIKDYSKLLDASDAANTIMEFKTRMKLTGNFEEVENIAKIIQGSFETQALGSVNKRLVQAGNFLKEITREKDACLKMFIECQPLVLWLKEKVKDQQELKVFVDLAMISAGESDMEIDRISCMHTSCLGFGSLIYRLKTEHGFNELISLCQSVWKAVEADPALPAKLESTCRQLPWLKNIEKSHGSVAYTTMMQAEAINAYGVYHIASPKKTRENVGICLENVISLLVPGTKEKNREEKTYSLEEVKDVQSKLMLIAGKAEKGKEEVDQFVEIFEGILRVGDLFVKLCEVGDIDYLTWEKTFQNNKSGRGREELLLDINDTCAVMEKALEKWMDKIEENRKDCYSLNLFTMKQILKLRKELASACTGLLAVDELPLQVYTLLESVCRDVQPFILDSILLSVVPETEYSGYLTEKTRSGDMSFYTNDEQDKLDEQNEPDAKMVGPTAQFHPAAVALRNPTEVFNCAREKLEESGYSDEVVVAALKAKGSNATVDELVVWSIKNGADKEAIDRLYEEALLDPTLASLLKDYTDADVDENSSSGSELDGLANRDENELVSEQCSPTRHDTYVKNKEDVYLTLPTLTDVLTKLATAEPRKPSRTFPTNWKNDESNLLLVPRGEIFASILTLYMGNGNQRLPTDEEVVMCDGRTTAEEIELLWRRAVVDKSGLLFCLANADLLDYDVSQQAVRSLEKITTAVANYRIVVICSVENEDKAHIIAELDRFRRHFPPLAPTEKIQSYLKKQLEAPREKKISSGNKEVTWQPAGNVDRENLSVRLIQSYRAGVGKSLLVQQMKNKLDNLSNNKMIRNGVVSSFCQSIPIHGVSADSNKVTHAILQHAVRSEIPVSRIYHLDISQSVSKDLDSLLFKLIILRTLKDSMGNTWRKKSTDLYVVELTTDRRFSLMTMDGTPVDGKHDTVPKEKSSAFKYSFLKFLPKIRCLSPKETLSNMKENISGDTGFDLEIFSGEEYQRTFHYLKMFDCGKNLDNFTFTPSQQAVTGDPADALEIIMKYCGIKDPSWAELQHFVNFLNTQLCDGDKSIFCNTDLVGDLLQGFRTFVVRFLIQMSRDFATRSLVDSDFSGEDVFRNTDEEDELRSFQIRRRWELSPHPYIFFNQDRNSMTFLGFLLSKNGDLLNPSNNEILERRLMNRTLRGQLKHQGVDFDKNYESWNRETRITNLCRVMGIPTEPFYDPDSNYELTTDNVEKILAIHMRFRCGIPVIIMGETGCGKTRLIRFMCELQAGPQRHKNILLMKVHGGTSYQDIEDKVKEAESLASKNAKRNIDTVLFFDEANTTQAIDLIKEIMVDRKVNGRLIQSEDSRLHFIAACNPYRKHSEEMIHKLESAGLGYHVSADETEQKLGSIPLRQLVYRVHPLPESMRPLVWDFGQLTDHTEELYTKQIVQRYFVSPIQMSTMTENMYRINGTTDQASCVAKVLSASQQYMRMQKNECSFVSLRDVERAMNVITWFYVNSELITEIVDRLKNTEDERCDSEDSDTGDSDTEDIPQPLNRITRALVLGIGVCYRARLNEREPFCNSIAEYFGGSCPLPGGGRRISEEISVCQQAFLEDIHLGPNIARNTALSENVFMMAICNELRIPLFVVGKPGSSKSLAKDVISSNMKGDTSQSELFRNLKQIHMQSYQCSPLSTPEGIISMFSQCAKLQKDKDLDKFVSVVVLDEIGLAEDSPLMPLKALHPLLEDGTATEETSSSEKSINHSRVGFIGLSNWALDPAKMNRGIMLSRGVPDLKELVDSAKGICSSNYDVQQTILPVIERLAKGYRDLYRKQAQSKTLKDAKKEEFFGLRDFYSLVKMVYGFALKYNQVSELQLLQAIMRNFSGLSDLNPVLLFSKHLPTLKHCSNSPLPECHPINLIEQSINRSTAEGESRYLLVLTENYAALPILQQQFLKGRDHDPVVIFGSSFPKDQQYTQICRNINRIKVCMETGRMVILLNLETLYESLYDALNQYYVYLAGQRYVDLGLGSHRVKCRVADDFKLIVVAEKDVVYQRFPIPLINRLEKHFLVMSTHLNPCEAQLVKELNDWVQMFSDAKSEHVHQESSFEPGDSFVGFHSDTAAAVIMKVTRDQQSVNEDIKEQILQQSKYTLLDCASPDAIARLPATRLQSDAREIWEIYFNYQKHKSLGDYLDLALREKRVHEATDGLLIQVTTHSRLLSPSSAKDIAKDVGIDASRFRCISLQEFHTEQQFTKTVQDFFLRLGGSEGLLFIQCDNGEANFNLVASCRYLVVDTRRQSLRERNNVNDNGHLPEPVHVIFVVQLPKVAGGCRNFVGFQGGKWRSVHIDELHETNDQLLRFNELVGRSVSQLFKPLNDDDGRFDEEVEQMDVDPYIVPEGESINDENYSANQKFNAALILRNCLQAAAARLDDESPNIDRATNRIEILLNMLPKDDSRETDFSRALVRRVYKLLKQRDEKCWQSEGSWLQNEALSRGRLQENGTFKKALWNKLSSIVSPILSEVIAFVDRNQNLNLLVDHHSWRTTFWIAMLNNERVTSLSYDSFISPSNVIRERTRVFTTGDGHRFDGHFPFSWIIKDIVNVLLNAVQATRSNKLKHLRDAISSSPLGPLLKPLYLDSNIRECAMLDYLHDFLHMVYKPIVENELELVFETLLAAAKGLHELSNPEEEFVLDVALIHLTYSSVQARLSCFAELVRTFPTVVQEVIQYHRQLRVNEMILDAVTLEWCIKNVEPREDELNVNEQRLIWCNNVQSIRPIIQVIWKLLQEAEKETPVTSNVHSFGEMSRRIINHCKANWVRVDVVRLFIEHTCPPGVATHSADAENAFRLWRALGDYPDFSSVEMMSTIEQFLVECLNRVDGRHSQFSVSQCEVCKNSLEDPVEMPCHHICCTNCAVRWFENQRICPICRHEVGQGFDQIVSTDECRRAVDDHNNFRNRCKSFFMELVALHCFGEESLRPPNPDLVQKFIGYVIKEDKATGDFTPFSNQGIDATPVVRSFILQQLLGHKGKEDQFRGHLEEYLNRARSLAMGRDHMVEVCVLCVQCMEDNQIMKLIKCKETSDSAQILLAIELLKEATENLQIDIRSPPNTFSVLSLQGVAAIRAAFDVLSSYLGKDCLENIKRHENFSNYLEVSKNLCIQSNLSPVRLFLLKQLVRKYGIDAVKDRCRNEWLSWILPVENQPEQTPDCFIVHKENYRRLREAFGKATLTGSTDELHVLLQNLTAMPLERDCYVLLSIFREITTRYAYEDVQRQVRPQVLTNIGRFIAQTNHLSERLKPLADGLLRNAHNGNVDHLRVAPGQNSRDRRLAEVVIHFLIVLECLPENQLLKPLRNLVVSPESMTAAYLPTMPHDYGIEAMQATDLGRWYECRNGHRYVITECGRPNQNYLCPGCGEPIGGTDHNLVATNREASRTDQTSTGHIIGPAPAQPRVLFKERNLSPLACGIVRFLTHAAMLLGASKNVMTSVSQIIKPPVANVIQFLWAHLINDIGCLAKSTAYNEDEAMQIIHLVLTAMINKQEPPVPGNVTFDETLSRKEYRAAWENVFVPAFLTEVFSGLSQLIQDTFGRMVRDERLGNNLLMRQLYELDSPNYDTMESLDPMCPALWRYRTRVSVDHLIVKFREFSSECTASPPVCEVLKEFIEKEHHLRSLQYLPDILKLQRQLSEKFHRRLDRDEADKYTLGNLLKRGSQLKRQFDELVKIFRIAWKIVRSSLTENGRLSLPSEFCTLEVNNQTPISMLLPNISGHGICALGLTSFLVNLHNDFVRRCRNLLGDASSLVEVPLANVTKAHLVAYDPEKDLLPMILAHCDYSLKVGEGTVVDYNWEALERQLVDRFIRGRAILSSQIPLFVFSKDVCQGGVFIALKQKIPQNELSRAVQEQILNELRQLTEICDVLKSIHIAIGFLSSAGGTTTMLIRDYFVRALRMSDKDGLKSPKAEQVCQLRHIISLWRLLSLERARILTKHKQDPFAEISDDVKKQLTNDYKYELSRKLRRLDVDHFVRELLEIILLYMKHVPQEHLQYPLSEYINMKLEEKGSGEIENLSEHIPDDIVLEHAVETWKLACEISKGYNESVY